MNIAFLFNSDHPTLGGLYGCEIMDKVLRTKVLQSEMRNMRISIGDILTYGATSRNKTPTF